MNGRGRLLVFEGMDSVGKTTLSKSLARTLNERKEPVEWYSFPGRLDHSLGALVYDIHHNPAAYDLLPISPLAKQLLHVAAHVDAIENQILPSLNAGHTVILDRFWWSTLIYGPRLEPSRTALHQVVKAEKEVWAGVSPDIVFLVVRNKPVDEHLWSESWGNMQQDYMAFASGQSESMKVLLVRNDQTITESMNFIVSQLDDLSKST